MHFAAHTIVPESVANPLKYYGNNTCATRTLLECVPCAGVKHVVFSSTAAVYGIPPRAGAARRSPTVPINPYGLSKLMSEWMLRDVAAAYALRYVALRYFNVAGCRPGRPHRPVDAQGDAAGQGRLRAGGRARARTISIFGTDYPTPDGTGVRDYIHVEDLAAAHLKALDYLRGGGDSTTLNCGYGHGYSVRDVLQMVERINGGQALNVVLGPRRAGDPPSLVAHAERIRDGARLAAAVRRSRGDRPHATGVGAPTAARTRAAEKLAGRDGRSRPS